MRNGYLGRFTGGGSSVLVVFLMLLLVTLGVLALSSTTNNLNMVTRGDVYKRQVLCFGERTEHGRCSCDGR